MCRLSKTVWSVCAHSAISVKECEDFTSRLDLTRSSCDNTCQQARPVLAYGWCPTCLGRFGSGPHPLYSETLIRHFWAYKAKRKWHMAVDAVSVPREAVFRPYPEGGVWKSTRIVSKGRDGHTRRHEVRWEELAIMDTAGRNIECRERCRYCKGEELNMNLAQFGVSARIATLNWARVNTFMETSRTEQPASSTPLLTEEKQLCADADRAEAFDLLNSISAAEGPSQRRFSHPELVPEPLRPDRSANDPPQVVETPERPASPSGASSINWLDECF